MNPTHYDSISVAWANILFSSSENLNNNQTYNHQYLYEDRADHLSNNLRLNKIFKLIFFQLYCKISRNQLETLREAAYGLHPNLSFEILNLKILRRSQVARRLGIYSNSQGADFNRFLYIETRSCYCCLVLYLHGMRCSLEHEIYCETYLVKFFTIETDNFELI